jgi:hypothetical protein
MAVAVAVAIVVAVAVDMAAVAVVVVMAVVVATAGKTQPISLYCKLSSCALSYTNPAAEDPRQGYFFAQS